MERTFKVSDRVLVEVKGFEPWPATIDNVVYEEKKKNVSYHVMLDGSSKSIPMNFKNLKRLRPVDENRWRSLCCDERWHEARKRNEVVEGIYLMDDHDMPSSLWNYVAVESDYENVPEVDKANLKLSRVAHNAKVRYTELETKFAFHTLQNKMMWRKKDKTEELVADKNRKSGGGSNSKSVIRFPCPMCSKKFKTRMALKKHSEYSPGCAEPKSRLSKTETPQQCPKCFALYRNEAMLIRHMVVHDKNLPKKKNGIRDYIRQMMSTNKNKVGSFYSANRTKPTTTNEKPISMLSEPKGSREASSPEESEEEEESENSTSDSDSWKSVKMCRTCRSKSCKCVKTKSRNMEIHSERERERRLEMRNAFQRLADILGVDKGNHPKQTLLTLARDEILNLLEAEKKSEQTLADLKDMYVRLVSREYQLNMMKEGRS